MSNLVLAQSDAINGITAGSVSVLATKVDASRLQGLKLRKLRFHAYIANKTAIDGPIYWGLSVGLSNTEIGEWISADPQHSHDEAAQQEADRKVFPMGCYPEDSILATGLQPGEPANFRTVRIPSWEVVEGDTLDFWVYNGGTTTIAGNTKFVLMGVLLGRWLND